MIYYQCRECGCKFAVYEKDIVEAERVGTYVSCPLDGRHDELKVIKDLMEERSAVQL